MSWPRPPQTIAVQARPEENDRDDEDDEEDEDDDESEDIDETKAGKTRSRAQAKAGANEGRGKPSGKPAPKVAVADLVLPATAKNAVLRVLAQALERLMAVANQVKEADAPGDDADASVPEGLTGELEQIGELLEDVAEELADPAAKTDGKKPGACCGSLPP